ncbi:MAG: hypothetical protein SCM11_06045, partial [Bacillota bacterium]|nr:hypothetical protein [Bacillota bacterium]
MRTIKILWSDDTVTGTIQIKNGLIRQETGESGADQVSFSLSDRQPLLFNVEEQPDRCGSNMTQLFVDSNQGAFTVRVMDINSKWPVWLPTMCVAVTTGEDQRTYEEVIAEIQSKKLLPELVQINQQPDESYENAVQENISLHGPAWLGLGQDMRIFSADLRSQEDDYWAWIEPRWAGKQIELPETNN